MTDDPMAWVHETPGPGTRLVDWAQSVQLPPTPDWTRVERDILRRSDPPAGRGFVLTLVQVVVSLLALLLIGFPLITVAILLIGTDASGALGSGPRTAALLTSLCSIAPAYTAWSSWNETGRARSVWTVATLIYTAGAAVACYLLLLGVPDDGQKEWVALLNLALAVASTAALVHVLVTAHGPWSGVSRGLPLRVRLRTTLSPPNEWHFTSVRNETLKLLMQHRRVTLSPADVEALSALPLGHWHTR